MPRSTHENRRYALASALAIIHEPDSEPAAILPAEMEEAVLAIRRLQAGGWHLIHADDLPAGYAPGDVLRHITVIGNPLPEPTAVLGETPDEMRRRLPMTEPVSHAVARELGWQEDPTPTTETPQEPTHEPEIPFGRELDADQQRISEIERTVHGQRLSAEGHARRTDNLEERATRLERITNDNARDAERRLTNLEERADDHDARIDALEVTTRNTTELQREIQHLRTTVHHHLESAYPHRSERHDTEAPDDPDQRLGGHDNPHDDDDQAHNDASNETR